MAESPAALWSQVRQALAGKETSVQASILDSTPRFYGDVYRVSVVISCAGYLFELIDEVGKSVHDFDLFQPTILLCNGILLDEDDGGELGGLPVGKLMPSEALRNIAVRIVGNCRDQIRMALVKLLPALAWG